MIRVANFLISNNLLSPTDESGISICNTVCSEIFAELYLATRKISGIQFRFVVFFVVLSFFFFFLSECQVLI